MKQHVCKSRIDPPAPFIHYLNSQQPVFTGLCSVNPLPLEWDFHMHSVGSEINYWSVSRPKAPSSFTLQEEDFHTDINQLWDNDYVC